VEYISTPIYDHQILAGAVVIFRDITERMENEMGLHNASQQLREALYMYLNVLPISCTPLRERAEDIPHLAAHLLQVTCRKLNRPIPSITERVMQKQGYSWAGNIRELHNAPERAVIISRTNKLEVEIVIDMTEHALKSDVIKTEAEIQALARANLVSALRSTGGKVAGTFGAAALLEMPPTMVYSRIKAFDIADTEWQ